MSLRHLLPTLDNAGRRLVLAEVLGQPVSMRYAHRRGRSVPTRTLTEAQVTSSPENTSDQDKLQVEPTPSVLGQERIQLQSTHEVESTVLDDVVNALDVGQAGGDDD